ncbi:MAG: PD-(D/E)XK nuclease family protein [Proteobacteria bacterium]|nr:PD-(D/E)XK nuclease family protein [Pseudomonadota bacterium]
MVVPTMAHIQLFKQALATEWGGVFIPPRIMTLSGWLALQPPADDMPAAASERLMSLYAGLRQHAWLKKLFSARRNTDLLPLAQTLLTLSDELTQSLLPQLQHAPDQAAARWQAALEQMTPSARHVLSDESQLVWSVWQSQLDGRDPGLMRFANMMRLAQQAAAPLLWINPVEPDAFEQAFLAAYGERQPVLPVRLDWRAATLPPVCALAWEELSEDRSAWTPAIAATAALTGLALCAADGIEDEATQGAQTVIDWLAAGKTSIAIVAQDRVAARRIRALLERAQVRVADETGWKLSTTRAAAALDAWFEVIASRAETVALLDFLKSPCVFAVLPDKSPLLMRIESALRAANVLGGWEAAQAALADAPEAAVLLRQIAKQAAHYTRRKELPGWAAVMRATLLDLGMQQALAEDEAGQQVLDLLDALEHDCRTLDQEFSFAEWRALVSLRLESTDFVPMQSDRRVVMLPLNGARLRSFDAVLLVGADAAHLPSQPGDTLFFANAVRRELGLATRESLQRQQLRDFAELLCSHADIVLSWQASKEGESNPVSPWVERLSLLLEQHRLPSLPAHRAGLTQQNCTARMAVMPTPAAPQLLPQTLSASGYARLMACPYQFFAERMLKLAGLDELSDLPQKRDYGDWLHSILKKFHDAADKHGSIKDADSRAALLQSISEEMFVPILARNPAALGYYTRWQKLMPMYLAWDAERTQQGWHYVDGESPQQHTLTWPSGEVVLKGRIDRIDKNADGEYAVIDYKTTSHTTLKARLQQREDHQLAFYGLLADRAISTAHYLALEGKDQVQDVEMDDYATWQQQLTAQITSNFDAIGSGAALPASGIEASCRYCAMRGLCRKGAWQ